ncbi:hypothetical protein [Ramlibacter sp.]|uniref:hypothetical protein n=1 Tax=Ramlibacter sp. TaxID=1917967 RepID=UPI002C5CC684|nr:hypothetical protein [Ramlibacter sp.]HWI82466.1 hypothetical protein [Ramlibacter sp.]
MKLLIALLAAAGLSGCAVYGGDPSYGANGAYGAYGAYGVPYSSGPVYYGNGVPYTVQPAPAYGHRRGSAWRDRDGDGIADRYDRDRDGDGVPNRRDARPNDPRRY